MKGIICTVYRILEMKGWGIIPSHSSCTQRSSSPFMRVKTETILRNKNGVLLPTSQASIEEGD
jgi:hypothetical protein